MRDLPDSMWRIMDQCPAMANGDSRAAHGALGMSYWQLASVILRKASRSTNGHIGNRMRSNRQVPKLWRFDKPIKKLLTSFTVLASSNFEIIGADALTSSC